MARVQDFNTVTPTDSDNLLVVQATGQGLATVGSTLGAKMDKANPTGTGSLSLNRQNNSVVGDNSSAIGTGTIANHKAQHVFGEYNLADTSTAQPTARGNYVEIVGKGTGDASRSNARTLDWSGNEVLAGDCTIMGNKSLNSVYTKTAGMRVQVVQGNTKYKAQSTGEGYMNKPYGVLIFGYTCAYLASSVSPSFDLGVFQAIIPVTGSAAVTLSNGVLQFGTDVNRQFVCIMPNSVQLVQQA